MGVGKDKHPPKRAERLRTSTNKKVVAKISKSVGAPVKTAEGSKRIRPGDGNKPPNTREAYVTLAMKNRAEARLKAEKERKGGRVYTPSEARAMQRKRKLSVI